MNDPYFEFVIGWRLSMRLSLAMCNSVDVVCFSLHRFFIVFHPVSVSEPDRSPSLSECIPHRKRIASKLVIFQFLDSLSLTVSQ